MVELAPGARITVRQPNVRTRFIFTEGPKGDKGDSGDVPGTRQIATGAGLTGGGDLSADRTLAVSFGTTNTTVARGNRGLPAGGTTGQVPIKGSATDYDVAWGTVASGASAPITQVFDASGTWTKPAGAKRVRVILIGGGGNGNGNTNGGGGGALLDIMLDGAELAATVSVTVGAAQGSTQITLANGSAAIAGGGVGEGGIPSLGGVNLAARATGATSATNAAAGGIHASGGGAGNSSSTLASATSLAGGAGGRVATTTGSGAAGYGAGGRSAPGTSTSPAGQDGDIKTARAGGGGYYVAGSTAAVGGKYGGGGAGAAAGGPGGACFITYFD